MENGLWEWVHAHAAFLYTVIIGKGWFYLDYWSFVHTWSGMVVMVLLGSLRFRHRWFWLVFFLAAYEALEVSFVFFTLHVFRPEKLNDQAMDMLVGVTAALAANLFLRSKEASPARLSDKLILMLFSSATFAFIVAGMVCGTETTEAVQMNHWFMVVLSVAGTGFLLLWQSPQIIALSPLRRLLLVALPYGILSLFVVGVLLPTGSPGWLILIPVLPLCTAGFYRWISRQVERARIRVRNEKMDHEARKFRNYFLNEKK